MNDLNEFLGQSVLQQAYMAMLDHASNWNRELVRQYYLAVQNYNLMTRKYWSDDVVMNRVIVPVVPKSWQVEINVGMAKVFRSSSPVCNPLQLWQHKVQPRGRIVFGQEVNFPLPGSYQTTAMVDGEVEMTTVVPGTEAEHEGKTYKFQKFPVPMGYVSIWVPVEVDS